MLHIVLVQAHQPTQQEKRVALQAITWRQVMGAPPALLSRRPLMLRHILSHGTTGLESMPPCQPHQLQVTAGQTILKTKTRLMVRGRELRNVKKEGVSWKRQTRQTAIHRSRLSIRKYLVTYGSSRRWRGRASSETTPTRSHNSASTCTQVPRYGFINAQLKLY
jgi:hypothetical protein